ncbi:MAG: hypothetical protein ACREMX_02965, partial [Gemmatimonadales bacterium]
MTLAVICCASALSALPATAQDSTFLLATEDPARAPSPFIGNGHLGVIVPALGLGGSSSFLAGLYEEAPGDVPRIVAIPAWNAIAVSAGDRWLDAERPPEGSVRGYRQVLDMRTGTARTGFEWVDGAWRTSVRVETFVSRADPHLAAIDLEVTPQNQGRMRVRFALAGHRPPRRLALARLERAEPSWRPADIWYPGHMVVRSRSATRGPGGGRI